MGDAGMSSGLAMREAAGDPSATRIRLIRITRREEGFLLLPLALDWYAQSRYRHLPFSQKKYWAQLDAVLVRGERGACFVAVRGEKVVGLINIAIGEPWLSEGGQHATCFAWLVAPQLRGSFLGSRVALRLLEAAKGWLAVRRVDTLYIHGTEEAGRLPRRLGQELGNNLAVRMGDLFDGSI